MASLPIKLIQPKDAIGKTVKGVLHRTGFLTFVFYDGTYVHVKVEMEWGNSPVLETTLTMDASDCTHHELTNLGLTDLAEAVRAEEIRRREAFQAHTEKREREEYERLKAKFHAT